MQVWSTEFTNRSFFTANCLGGNLVSRLCSTFEGIVLGTFVKVLVQTENHVMVISNESRFLGNAVVNLWLD